MTLPITHEVERDEDGLASKVIIRLPVVHSFTDEDIATAVKAFEMCIFADEIIREKERAAAGGQPRTRPMPAKRAGAMASYDHASATAPIDPKEFG